MQNCIKPRVPLTRISVSLAYPPSLLQATIIQKQAQIRSNVAFKYAVPRHLVFFLDDLHLASSAVRELVIHLSKHHCLFDYHRNFTHGLSNVQLLSSCSPTCGRHFSARLFRSLVPIMFFTHSDELLCKILYHQFVIWLQNFALYSLLEETAKVCVFYIYTSTHFLLMFLIYRLLQCLVLQSFGVCQRNFSPYLHVLTLFSLSEISCMCIRVYC